MKKIYYLLIFALIATMAVSCDDGVDSVERFIELDLTENAIVLSDAGQEKFVKVTTDKNNSFAATWSGDAWAKVVNSAEGFTIQADENTGDAPRVAAIMVVLEQGGEQVKVTVTQTGKAPMISTMPDKLWFSQFAGSKELLIITNQKDWKVEEPTSDWATVVVLDPKKGIITVDVTENILDTERSIDIVLTAAKTGISNTITITQSEVATYMMPYLEFGASVPDIRAFEENRGSTYYYGRDVAYVWNTASEVMPRVHYTLDEDNIYFLDYAEIYYTKSLFDLSKYTAFLATKGYEYMFNEPTPYGEAVVSWKEPNLISVNIEVSWGDEGYVIFEERPIKPGDPDQKEPMPTFASYPWGFHTVSASFNDVKVWEAANGGTLYQDFSKDPVTPNMSFLTKSTPIVARTYIQSGVGYHPGVTRMISIIDDVSMAMYSASMTNILTKEFKALVEAAGWTPEGGSYKPGANHFFNHVAKDLRLQVYDTYFEDLEGYEYEHVLCLSITPLTSLPSPAPNVERPQDDTSHKVILRGNKREAISIRNIK